MKFGTAALELASMRARFVELSEPRRKNFAPVRGCGDLPDGEPFGSRACERRLEDTSDGASTRPMMTADPSALVGRRKIWAGLHALTDGSCIQGVEAPVGQLRQACSCIR